MTAANEPLQQTSKHRSNKPMAGSKTTMTFKPMSRLPLSDELQQYTQSMKTYLASVESRPNDRRPSDSEESEPDRSPEFRWMDLNALQRKYSHQSMSNDGVRRVISSPRHRPHQSSNPAIATVVLANISISCSMLAIARPPKAETRPRQSQSTSSTTCPCNHKCA